MGPAYWILYTALLISVLFLVIFFSYFTQKEYTAEIERLRRDLAATRDRSGVFMASENYTQMIMQLEQQAQEIGQTLAHMKALKEEMDKKEDLCNQLSISLDSCNQKLAATFSELEATQDKLNDTSLKLQDTVNKCAEKEHLIEKHVHTERTLTTQAGSLLAVADMASSDVRKLHDKLARKRSVEDVNQEVSEKYHQKFLQHIACMEDSLNGFIQDLVSFCSRLQRNLGEHLEKRSTELTSLSDEISSLMEGQTVLIQELLMMSSNKVQNDQQWIKQYLTSVHSTSDGEISNLHGFHTDAFLVPMRNLAHQLHLQEAENQAFNQMIVSQIQQKLDALQTFEIEHSDGLSKLRDSILLLTREQHQALENAKEGYHGMDKILSTYKQALLTDVQQLKSLADHMLASYVNFENECNDNKNKINIGLSVAQEKCDHLSQESSTIIDLQQMRIEHLGVYEAEAEELLKKVGISRETSEQLTAVAKRLGEDVEAGVLSTVSHGEQAWRNHYSWTEHELRKYSENLNAAFQNELQQTQTLVSGLTASAESHEAILEQQRADFGAFVRERQDDLENHCSYISGWSQSMTTGLQQCSQDVGKFLNEDLQKDIPTGNTPQRSDFSYPRVLAATSPHERILARFREASGAIIPHIPTTEVVSSPPGSSDVNSEISSSDNKENTTTGAMKKHHPDDLQNLKKGRPKIASSGKVLQAHN